MLNEKNTLVSLQLSTVQTAVALTFFNSIVFPTLYCNRFIFLLWFHLALSFVISIKIASLRGEGRGEYNRHKTQISNTLRSGRF